MNKVKIKPRGVYLIQEPGCLNPYSGAFNHINVGLSELGKNFDMNLYLNSTCINLNEIRINSNHNKHINIMSVKKRGYFYGSLKDIHLFIMNFINFFKVYKMIKSIKPDFIYERSKYLDFKALIACKILKIPHFYESNDIHFLSNKKYYNSILTSVIKIIEKNNYRLSSHVFFVGSYGDFWKIKKNNWTNVENGIESNLISPFSKLDKEKKIIEICFVGRYMKHQRLELLVDALQHVDAINEIRINFFGTGLDNIEQKIRKLNIKVINHGFIGRSKIISKLKKTQICVICGSPEYQSCMKLFDYAAAGCAVIAPKNYNLLKRFKNELIFFDGTSQDFSKKIQELINNKSKQILYSKKLQNKVLHQYTWSKIFSKKTEIIKSTI